MPVGDGFAPHSQRPPISSAASHISHTGSFGSLPPPYTQYPGHISPKPEDDEVDLGAARPFASQLDPGASMGDGEARRRRSRRVVAGAVVEVPDADAVSVGGGSDPHANDESGAVKEWKDKRLFGGRLWVIILAGLAALLVGIAVGLGVGLGIGLQKAKAAASSSIATTTTNYQPSPENTSPPTSEPNNLYPDIPTGKTAISPLKLKAFNNECKISSNKSSTPDIFSQGSNGLWSCNIPNQKPLMWDVLDWPASLASAQLSKLGTVPPTLTCAQWEGGLWGGYLISSVEGEYQQDQKNTVYITQDNQTVLYASSRFREGLQDPAFYRQPLAFLNVTWQPDPSVPNRKRDAGTINSLSYNFGTLYNKTVILKESTMIETFNSRGSNPGRYGNGSEFVAGDKVWMCTWEKTLLEVEIMVNEHSLAVTNKGNTAHAADSRKTYNDDDNGTTTITVSANTGTVSFPPPFRSSSASTSQPSGTFSFPASPTVPHGHHPRPPPPPPPPPSPSPQPPRPPSETDVTVVVSEDFEFVGDMRRIRQKRDGSSPGNGPRCYPKKVKIKEYRPTPNRLRQVLGIDLTDADPTGQGIPGRVYCRKFIAQDDGGLQAYPSKRGEVVEVELKEDYVFTSTNAGSGSRKRQSGPNSTTTDDDEDGLDDDSSMKCLCNWHS
ncbi:hypothetical protein FN846DRAFT_779156 [Sphaerosporella brunnea]|uniref:DUF7820 domain-containing protein n=1 Tax=Sphaerosporella brunnea TaxID=1250544 RepID=A0A5J5EVX0_9PEZI|nr:hypothetical protein FN846DRAFT_779156 [Sphaerosporella brunnea]